MKHPEIGRFVFESAHWSNLITMINDWTGLMLEKGFCLVDFNSIFSYKNILGFK